MNIFSKLGDVESLHLLHRKYPTPESISITLLPHYIRALQCLGGAEEIHVLARLANTFWGLYRAEILAAFESITERTGRIEVGEEVVHALQYLYDAGDEPEKIKVIGLCNVCMHQLLLSILLCGIESENRNVRKAAIRALGKFGGATAISALRRAFQNEQDESLLEEYADWLFRESQNDPSFPSS
ncbi:MAG: HEAT repeat domain-containing protein [Bacteroidota bacterium]|nr:HEAT repeat domain-containing protein [Bacteroidota bacterium]